MNRLEEIEKRWVYPGKGTLAKLDDDMRWLVTELELVNGVLYNARKEIENLKDTEMVRENVALKGTLNDIDHEIMGKTTIDTIEIAKYLEPWMYKRHI